MRISDWSSDRVLFRSGLWILTAWRWLGAQSDAPTDIAYLILAWVLAGLVGLQGWFGGEMVYGHGAGVAPAGQGQQPSPRQTSLEGRSEEHTSELQSLMRTSYAVVCVKKKHRQHPMMAARRRHVHKSVTVSIIQQTHGY